MKNEVILDAKINLVKETENFISYLDVSPLTLRSYYNGIKAFLEYLDKENVKNPTRDDFRGFRDTLKQNVSINTTNSYLSAVRRFFAYLELNKIYENITKDIKNVRTANIPVRQTLSLEKSREIYKSLTDKRERAMFALAITTGMRAEEIASAKIDNIKMYNGEIVLFHKCKKRDDESEYVKLSDEVLNDIVDYIGNRTTGNIFVSESNHNKNGGVTYATVRRTIKAIFKRFGYDSDGFSCHSLRRTSATLMYENGADIKAIQQVLHHRSTATTNRYIQQSCRDKNNAEKMLSNLILG